MRKVGYEIRPLSLNGASNSIIYNSKHHIDRFYNDSKLLEEYIKTNVPDHITNLFTLLREKKLNLENKRIIDVGCGTGHCLKELKDTYKNIQLKGTEFASAPLKIASEVAVGIPILKLDITTNTLSETFDVVLCQQVLEHIPDYETALQHLWQMTAPCGYLLLTIPDGRLDSFAGHIHFWSIEGFTLLLKKALNPKEITVGTLQDGFSLYALLLKA